MANIIRLHPSENLNLNLEDMSSNKMPKSHSNFITPEKSKENWLSKKEAKGCNRCVPQNKLYL